MNTALAIIGVLVMLGFLALLALAGGLGYRELWQGWRRTARRD